MATKTFRLPIYGRTIKVLTTAKEVQRVLKEDKNLSTISGCCFTTKGDPNYYIYVNTERYDDGVVRMSIPVVSHECVHAAMDVLYDCGVIYGPDNQEAVAYLQDYLTDVIISWWIDKRHGKICYHQKHVRI